MDDRYATLALGYLRGLSHQSVLSCLQAGKRPSQLLRPENHGLLAGGETANSIASELASLKPRIRHGLELLEKQEIRIIGFGEDDYPRLLTEIPDPPPFLYLLGNTDVISLPQIAIVGSRASSRSGQRHVYDIAGQLVRGGFAITSGLALGIDGAAHRGALDAGGITVAVMGTGLDQVYPLAHKKLAANILSSGGALLSEFPPDIPPRRENFPRRNRIVSGLSCVAVVAEAQARSGSLITARLAMEQGRTVCAIPGGIGDPLKAGCHHLIREGAVLVRGAADIAEAAADLVGVQRALLDSLPALVVNQKNHPLLELMGADPLGFDRLLELSGLDAAELARELGELEIAGDLYRSSAGYRRTN